MSTHFGFFHEGQNNRALSLILKDGAGDGKGGIFGRGGLDSPFDKLKTGAKQAARVAVGGDLDAGDAARKHAGAGVVVGGFGGVSAGDARHPAGPALQKPSLGQRQPREDRPVGVPRHSN